MNKTEVLLKDNVKFHLGDIPESWQAWLDDSDWKDVTIPHDWSVEQPFSKAYSSGTGYLAGGIGWYRFHFSPDESFKGKSISITFDSVYKNSRVWCNSYYLGERPNGYISFTYDITDFYSFEHENIISVYVDHRDVADSRWFTGSGVVGKVTLTAEERIHPVHDGIFFTSANSSFGNESTFSVENEIVNTLPESKNVKVINKLVDRSGAIAAIVEETVTIEAMSTAFVNNRGVICEPRKWSPEEPYLYTLETYIGYDGSISLADSEKVGIRDIRFDANEGFFLNDKSYKFKGVCVHHDAGCLGAAVLPVVWERRLKKLKKMGCNAIRMSHNPHMPELYSLCDEMGFMVMDEAFDEWEGPKNKWSTGHNVYPPKHQGYYVNFHDWAERDLVDMIRRDRNHPSTILWSIGNEIDYPNDPYCHASFKEMTGNNDKNKPAAERQYNAMRPDSSRLAVLAKYLSDIVKKTDSTHPATLAAAFPELSANIGFIDSLDVVGYNYRENLYLESHKKFPDKAFLGSENGHTYRQWRAVTDNDYISGQFLWTGIDYLGEAMGWPVRVATPGLISTAGFEKPLYARRQSFWALEPVIHISTMRESEKLNTPWGQVMECPEANEFGNVSDSWNYNLGEKVLVKIYSNIKDVSLYINDKPAGTFTRNYNNDCIIAVVDFEPGEIKTVAEYTDPSGEVKTVSHSLKTVGVPTGMRLTKYVPECETSKINFVEQVEIALVDAYGNEVLCDSSKLTVKVEGGTLIGLENGDNSDLTEYSAHYRHAYHGKLIAYVRKDKDSDAVCRVSVSGEYLATAVIEL